MNRIVFVCAFFMLILTPPSSMTQTQRDAKPDETVPIFFGTGNELFERCGHPPVKPSDIPQMSTQELVRTAKDNGLCFGFIIGVSDEALVLNNLSDVPRTKQSYCPPSEVHPEQLIMVVKKYLEDHPAQLHIPAVMLTIRALRDAFPCK